MPRDEESSKTDEAGFRAVDEDVGWSETVTAIWARGVIPCAGSKTIRVVSMKSMTRDQLKTRQLKIA